MINATHPLRPYTSIHDKRSADGRGWRALAPLCMVRHSNNRTVQFCICRSITTACHSEDYISIVIVVVDRLIHRGALLISTERITLSPV